ncbi:MAG TPA: 7TM diverse intracellular signaling domain-containing protein [Niastella sp.]
MAFLIRQLVLLTGFIFCIAYSQAQAPVQHLSAGTSTYHLKQTLAWYEDKSAGIDARRITAGELDNQFKQHNAETLNFGVTRSVIWLKFSLQNKTPQRVPDWILSLDYPLFDYVTLYVQKGNNWQTQLSGDMLPYSVRPMKYRHFAFTLDLPDTNTTTCYIRLASSGSMQINVNLQQPTAFVKDDLYAELGHGIFFGALLIMMCYNLFLYVGLRDKAYLAYVAFILVNLLLQATFSGHTTQFILGNSPYWANHIIPILMSASSIVMAAFSITFLNTRQFAKTIHTVLLAIVFVASANLLSSFWLKLSITISGAGLLVIIACVTVIVAGIISLRKGNRAARFYLLAWALLIISGLITSFRNFGFLAPGFFTTNCIRIASMVEAVLLAMALADRYNQYKKEKEAAQAETLRIQQEANRDLEEKVMDRTKLLHQSLEELKTAQAKLVQKEKMASLGELTAGIAHEIQNPLNFVTNFAEVSEELVEDLKTEVKAGAHENALTLVDYLSSNLNKIVHHGKRAGSIVKGMLLHSRKDIGETMEIDVCALADDCLKLAYQSFKTKNNTCNVQLTKHFEYEPVMYACNPQELDRVLMNLFANALYALDKRKTRESNKYQPVLSVSIRQIKTGIEIVVHDNGTGMSASVQEKIFQPFFTTKPANQGTGLGLSISFDIITKGFGGELTVTSAENAFTAFTIRLPLHPV